MMYLKIPVIKKRYYPLRSKMKTDNIPNNVQEEFAYYLAEEMKNYLKRVIKYQKYKRYWKPLNPDYLKWKKKKGLSTNIWEASGILVNSITVRKYKDHYIIGPSKNKKYPNSDLSIYEVARMMEYGTENMPARPLFRRVLIYMRKNVDRYYKKFLKEKKYI